MAQQQRKYIFCAVRSKTWEGINRKLLQLRHGDGVGTQRRGTFAFEGNYKNTGE
jgi:hypothetical protein